jgi:hypothetical protein
MTSAPYAALPSTSDVTSKLTCDMLDTLPLQPLAAMAPPGSGWSTANNITSLAAQSAYLSSSPNVDALTFTINFNMTQSTFGRPYPEINGVGVITASAISGPALTCSL